MPKEKTEVLRISKVIMTEVRKRKTQLEKKGGYGLKLKEVLESLIGDGLDKK